MPRIKIKCNWNLVNFASLNIAQELHKKKRNWKTSDDKVNKRNMKSRHYYNNGEMKQSICWEQWSMDGEEEAAFV